MTGVGAALVDLGRPREAIAVLERALAIADPGPLDPLDVALLRFGLARALWDSHEDRPRARTLATAARDVFASGGEVAAAGLAEIRGWLGSQQP